MTSQRFYPYLAMRILLVVLSVTALSNGMEMQHSLGAGCSAIGQYVLHPTNRCQYVHCVFSAPVWGTSRSEFVGVARFCPYGTAVPQERYIRPGGYGTFHLGAMCSEWVANPYWKGRECKVVNRGQQMELSNFHVHHALPRFFTTKTGPKYATGNGIQQEVQKIKSPAYKKAYDDGAFYRPEIMYDIANTKLEEQSQVDKPPFKEEPFSYNYVADDGNYFNNDLDFSENSDYYVMGPEAGSEMLRSVSNLAANEDEEYLTAEESRKMKADLIALGYGHI